MKDKLLDADSRFKFNPENIDDLLQEFKNFGAVVTPGTGKLFVQGKEVSLEDVFLKISTSDEQHEE